MIRDAPEEMETAWRMRAAIGETGKKAGFVFVAIDVQGYRTGAMNELLSGRE